MGPLKDVFEPAAIAITLAFTFGALLNRRRRHERSPTQGSRRSPPSFNRISSLDVNRSSWLPNNTMFHNNPTSRFLSTFPFLVEIWYWNLTYWIYQLARAYSAHLIRHDARSYELAEKHALSILRIEHIFGIDVELRVQQEILEYFPWLMTILASIYYSHILIGVCFIAYTYTCLPFLKFARIRRTLAMDNILAFIVLTAWRCKPPRLMPKTYGYIDVLHPNSEGISNSSVPERSVNRLAGIGEPSAWNNNPYQLTIAAMPSLHFGTSLFLAASMMRYSPHRLLRTLAPLWPASMLLTILATANHWLLDAVVGALVPFMGWQLNQVLNNGIFEAIEAWGFWLLRTEKPPGDYSEDK